MLGLWDSHPSLAEDIRGHRFGPPLDTMRSYLDALDTAAFGPPGAAASPHRVLASLRSDMLTLAAERVRGATVLGMPIEYTRTARTVLGNDALVAVTQRCLLGPDYAKTADLARIRPRPPCRTVANCYENLDTSPRMRSTTGWSTHWWPTAVPTTSPTASKSTLTPEPTTSASTS
ncbi:hypothetical protein AB0N17_33655 [Streptomyces sp. NPDC051133]|uniref:hypothetical protein n=1 Tax=Streptomyces sp. NPDC051133 TaxID=3155521 RepID=UPI003428C585